MIHQFFGFYLPAILWTIAFFAILFFLAALWNRHRLVSTNVIALLHEDQKPVKVRQNKIWKFIEAVLGLGLLAVGYWAMWDYKDLMTKSIVIGFFTIVIGSYFIFDSFFTGVINLLRKNKKFEYHQLRSFTLGQLRFRLGDYNRILTVISLLFALALGAITVGLNFNNLTETTMKSTYYDVVLHNQGAKVQKQLKKVSIREKNGFNYKVLTKNKGNERDTVIYVNEKEIAKNKLKYQKVYQKNGQQAWKTITMTPAGIKKHSEDNYQLSALTSFDGAKVKVISAAKYHKLKAANHHVELLLVNDFRKNFANIEKLQKLAVNKMMGDLKTSKDSIEITLNNSKSAQYRLISAVASGFEFMGFFLGIAFLAMLASTLMFKVLSGANSDRSRYRMLWKIGAQEQLLRASIRNEIGTLFALPALLGIVDVLFGLQFFKSMLENPYDKIWLPFTIFLILYLLYYLITVKLYEDIVLKKQRLN